MTWTITEDHLKAQECKDFASQGAGLHCLEAYRQEYIESQGAWSDSESISVLAHRQAEEFKVV